MSHFHICTDCNCDPSGTVDEICDKQFGECMCKQNYTGERCDRCEPGFYGYPSCEGKLLHAKELRLEKSIENKLKTNKKMLSGIGHCFILLQ